MSKDLLRLLADARPSRLDPDPDGHRANPSAIMAHPRERVGAPPAVRRSSRRLVLAGLVPTVALAAAGTVLLTIVAVPGGGGGAPTGGPSTEPAIAGIGPVPQAARELLLVAAERSLSNPTAGGRYWMIAQESGHLMTVGPANRPYQIVSRMGEQQWLAMTPGDESRMFIRELGAEPVSAEDKAAWKADGSPTEWTQRGTEHLPDAERPLIKATPGPETSGWRGSSMRPDAKRVAVPRLLAGHPVSPAELSALSTDPAELKAWLLDRLKTSRIGEASDQNLFQAGAEIIFGLPVAPPVRAAAYRMLADVEGVTSLGEMRDRKGRSGTAVAYAWKDDDGTWRQARLIINPETGQPLAQESWTLGQGETAATTGTLQLYTLVLSAGYRDDTPPADGVTS